MGDGGKIEQQDLISDMRFISIVVMHDFGRLGWGKGAKKELQDLIPDLILTTIFIN